MELSLSIQLWSMFIIFSKFIIHFIEYINMVKVKFMKGQ